jgi:hypothetical protein
MTARRTALRCYLDGALSFTLPDFTIEFEHPRGKPSRQVFREMGTGLRFVRFGGGWQFVEKPRLAAWLGSFRLYDHLRTAAQVAQAAARPAERVE